MKFRTKAAAEKELAKILKVLDMFKQAEEAVEHDFFSQVLWTQTGGTRRVPIYSKVCKNPANIFSRCHGTRGIEIGLAQRKRLWPLNKCLLEDYCPKRWEFELIEEPTVFIKVPDIKLTNDEYSQRIIQYTDYWQHLNGY